MFMAQKWVRKYTVDEALQLLLDDGDSEIEGVSDDESNSGEDETPLINNCNNDTQETRPL